MSKTITNKDLKEELGFVTDKAQVYCRDLGYGYQLVLRHKDIFPDGENRIFIRKLPE